MTQYSPVYIQSQCCCEFCWLRWRCVEVCNPQTYFCRNILAGRGRNIFLMNHLNINILH